MRANEIKFENLNNSKRLEWNDSYKRGENHILYPQAEVVRFLNRYISKRKSIEEVSYVLNVENRKIKLLDFACGVGVHSVICQDFDIEAYGVDISYDAINTAKKNAVLSGQKELSERFSLIENDQQKLDFSDRFFDCAVAESCLDSMPFEYAKRYMEELKRVTSAKIYFSVISSKCNNNTAGETLVQGHHEKGTIQNYYDLNSILKLTSSSLSNFDFISEITNFNVFAGAATDSRYFCSLNLLK